MKNLALLTLLLIGLAACSTRTIPTKIPTDVASVSDPKEETIAKIETSEILWDTWGVPHIYAPYLC